MKLTTDKPQELTIRDERLIFAMQLLGEKTRYKIFKLLLADSELCVTEIAERLNVSASAVSQHFRQFEQLGLVDKKRAGQKICYLLRNDDDMVSELINVVTSKHNQRGGTL